MKAILVIDLDGDISRYHANIYKEDDKGNGEIIKSYCPLKPLPKKFIPVVLHQCVEDEYLYQKGWNDCLKEIAE